MGCKEGKNPLLSQQERNRKQKMFSLQASHWSPPAALCRSFAMVHLVAHVQIDKTGTQKDFSIQEQNQWHVSLQRCHLDAKTA